MEQLIIDNQIRIMAYINTISEQQCVILSMLNKEPIDKINNDFVLKMFNNNIEIIEGYKIRFSQDPIKVKYYDCLIKDIQKDIADLSNTPTNNIP